MNATTELEIDYELTIRRVTRQAAGSGTWVIGRVDNYRFDALVFEDHAVDADWELGDSRISKLWVRRISDKTNVYNWDRGADIEPVDAEVQQVVDFLAGGLADVIFGV